MNVDDFIYNLSQQYEKYLENMSNEKLEELLHVLDYGCDHNLPYYGNKLNVNNLLKYL